MLPARSHISIPPKRVRKGDAPHTRSRVRRRMSPSSSFFDSSDAASPRSRSCRRLPSISASIRERHSPSIFCRSCSSACARARLFALAWHATRLRFRIKCHYLHITDRKGEREGILLMCLQTRHRHDRSARRMSSLSQPSPSQVPPPYERFQPAQSATLS